MSDQALIVAELKRALRERGLTYAAVASKLGLSVASIKRLFSTGDFSLARVDQICELMGTGLRELLEQAEERAAPSNPLTLAQEQELVSDPKLLFLTWLVVNRTSFEDIVRLYRFTDREALGYLIRLDRLKVIELQPANHLAARRARPALYPRQTAARVPREPLHRAAGGVLLPWRPGLERGPLASATRTAECGAGMCRSDRSGPRGARRWPWRSLRARAASLEFQRLRAVRPLSGPDRPSRRLARQRSTPSRPESSAQ